MKTNFSYKKIILFINLSVFLGLGSVLSLSLWNTFKNSKTFESIHDGSQELVLAKSVQFHGIQIQQFLTDASLTKDEGSIKEAEENLDQAKKGLAQLSKLRPEDREKFQHVEEMALNLWKVGNEMTLAYWNQGFDAGNTVMKSEPNGFDKASEAYAEAIEAIVADLSKEQEEAVTMAQSSNSGFLLVLFAVGLSLMAVTFVILNKLLKSSLQRTIDVLESSMKRLEGLSGEMREVSTSLSNSAVEESSSLEETSASMTEVSSLVARNTESIAKIREATSSCQSLVELGSFSVEGLDASVGMVANKSKEITGIVSIIDELAFQTNLLSLNAAVEAARAGEQGRGFAVVADAVRSLAHKTLASASDVKTLINETSQAIERTTEAQEVVARVFSDLKGSFAQLGEQAQMVAEASTEQSRGVDQIHTALNQIQASSMGLAQTSETASALASQSGEELAKLDHFVEDMKKSIAA